MKTATRVWGIALAGAAMIAGCEKKHPERETKPPAAPIPTAEGRLPERSPGQPDPVVKGSLELDEALAKAKDEAQSQWDKFEASFRSPPKFAQHSVKVPMPVKGEPDMQVQFIWVWVQSIDGDRLKGKIANDPTHNIGHRLGDEVSFTKADVADWLIFIPPETQIGGFSVKVLQDYEKSRQPPK